MINEYCIIFDIIQYYIRIYAMCILLLNSKIRKKIQEMMKRQY